MVKNRLNHNMVEEPTRAVHIFIAVGIYRTCMVLQYLCRYCSGITNFFHSSSNNTDMSTNMS